MLEFFYNITIQPLIYLYELLFRFFYQVLPLFIKYKANLCLYCILIVSIAVNLLTLPLYDSANKLQDEESKKQKSMQKWVDHIKKHFKGDERFLMLTTYYKEQNYKPIYSIRASISLLLQIPFFTAAYIFFNNCSLLHEAKVVFLPFISNLSMPDNFMYVANGFYINILPITMTIINLIASYIWTRDMNLKDKIEPVILAFIFLFLLYNSPSGLVLYWTFNNIFSLLKIILYKLFNKNQKIKIDKKSVSFDKKSIFIKMILFLILFFVVAGLLIPTYVISARSRDFFQYNQTPYALIIYIMVITFGYTLWFLIIFLICDDKIKRILALCFTCFIIYAIINHFTFGNNFGILTELLVYEKGFGFGFNEKRLDIIILFLVILFIIITYKKDKIHIYMLLILTLSTILLCVNNIILINADLKDYYENSINVTDENISNKFTLSKNGKNVIVIMLDRCIGSYFNYCIGEKKELITKFDGFVFYKNTLSCSNMTVSGAPALFGGYDYTTDSINKRKDVNLKIKHNEALTIMPYNFSNNNFNVYISNLPYENYGNANEKSIFDDFKNTKKINLNRTKVYNENIELFEITKMEQKRNFIFFNIMRFVPVVFKGVIYNNGDYLSEGSYYPKSFFEHYLALNNLQKNTNISNDNSNNILLYVNEITHNTVLLPYGSYMPTTNTKLSDFEYKDIYDNDGNKFDGNVKYLGCEICAFLELSRFFDYLKENNIYNNTRIIITSDHGFDFGTLLDARNRVKGFSVNQFNPVLLVKDFNKKGNLTISEDFMTNADTVPIAMENIIENPVNPYLNKKIQKKNTKQKVPFLIYTENRSWHPEFFADKFLFKDLMAVYVGGSIFDANSYDDVEKYK